MRIYAAVLQSFAALCALNLRNHVIRVICGSNRFVSRYKPPNPPKKRPLKRFFWNACASKIGTCSN
jgi:hypothetical protein